MLSRGWSPYEKPVQAAKEKILAAAVQLVICSARGRTSKEALVKEDRVENKPLNLF